MKLTSGIFIVFSILTFIISCTKDRIFSTTAPVVVTPAGTKDSIVFGTLVINEYEVSGSQFDNELTPASDWFEIYNTTKDTIVLEQNKWFVTDGLASKTKFKLPPFTLLPKGFKIIWCDSKDSVLTEIHTNFGLSSAGEQIGIFFQKSASDSIVPIDTLTYGTQSSGISKGRTPDGGTIWVPFAHPTPGASND